MSRLETRSKSGKPHILVDSDLDSSTENVLHFCEGDLQSHPFESPGRAKKKFRVLLWNNSFSSVIFYQLVVNDVLWVELSGQFSVCQNLINLKSDFLLKSREISLKQRSIMIVNVLVLDGPRTVRIFQSLIDNVTGTQLSFFVSMKNRTIEEVPRSIGN